MVTLSIVSLPSAADSTETRHNTINHRRNNCLLYSGQRQMRGKIEEFKYSLLDFAQRSALHSSHTTPSHCHSILSSLTALDKNSSFS